MNWLAKIDGIVTAGLTLLAIIIFSVLAVAAEIDAEGVNFLCDCYEH